MIDGEPFDIENTFVLESVQGAVEYLFDYK